MTTQGMTQYQPEREVESSPSQPTKKSKVPKVLGVLHLVVGGITALSGLFGVFSGKSQADNFQEKFAGGATDIVVSDSLLEKLSVLDAPSRMIGGVELLVSLLMIVAGIGLLKYAQWGRRVSNCYGVLSLLAKAANVYVVTVLAAPFYEEFIATNEALQLLGTGGMLAIVLSSVAVTCVYPVVSLILVNLKSARLSLR